LTVTKIKAIVNPTEDKEKIVDAIVKIFGEIELEISDKQINGELVGLKALSTLRSRIGSDKIKATLEKVFNRGKADDCLSFGLNRQAAHAGHVSINLDNEDPMGPIQVTIDGDVDEVITFLTEYYN
jgi:predicted RNA binding protein with dsRBD fold (UPF0201 family)